MDTHTAYPGLEALAYGRAWAILPEKLAVMERFFRSWIQGHRLTAEEIDHVKQSAKPRQESRDGTVAVLPLYGVISQRANLFSEASGGTSTESFAKAFRQALKDPEVSAIILDIDSPGGAVAGVEELAQQIYQARGQKPMVAVANSLAASAAYWIATAADETAVTPSGEVGSIGVYMMHMDESAFNEKVGMKPTYISAGRYKVEGNPDQPLSTEALTYLQSTVDDYYELFTQRVARNRGVKKSDVVNGFGEGRVVTALNAVKLGMADRVATLDQEIARIARPRRSTSSMAARHRWLDVNTL